MKPPSANELVGPPPHGLDQKWALKNFLGKTREEARDLCRQSSAVTEDFTYMAASGLCYYLPAALSYLESDDSTGDWDFAHGLMCALSSQVDIFGMRGEPLVLIKQVSEYCDSHREKFDLTSEDLFDGYLETIRSAEPNTSPNGGPAASIDNSNAPGGPPSVS
jgi:hypothetical protein